MSVRLPALYLRSRSAGPAVALLALVPAAVWLWWVDGSGHPGLTMALAPMMGPLAAAVIVAVGARSPFGEVEAAAGHRLPWLRLLHLPGLMLLAGAGLGLAAMGWSLPDAPWILVRNLIGLTGVALISARVLGAGKSWLPPLAYVVLCGGAVDQQNVTGWTWPALGATDVTATMLALALVATGLVAVVPSGARN